MNTTDSSLPPSPPARPSLRPPTGSGSVGIDNAVLTRAVHQQQMQNRRDNTSIAYDPKVLEFKRYCDCQYPHEPEFVRHLVSPDKVYNFMFYQAHRDKRKPGRQKRDAPVSEFGAFSNHDYDSVIGRYVGKPCSEWVQPKNPLGYQQVNTYKSSLIELHKEQVANRANTYVRLGKLKPS
jgi:hypothetical protein